MFIDNYILKRLPLTEDELRVTRLILFASIFQGVMQGIWLILPEVARNTLHADKTAITIITLLWPVGQLFAVYWSDYMDGLPNKSRILIGVGLFGRLPFAFGALFSTVEPILMLFFISVTTHSAVIAAQHSIIQASIRKPFRGKIFSFTISVMMTTSLLSAATAGNILDMNEQFYRLIIIVAAVAGFIETMILSRTIVISPLANVFERRKIRRIREFAKEVSLPWRQLIRLFREDRDFFRYEMNFFVYGIGWMIIQPFITLFLVDDMKLEYTQISLAKGAILQGMAIMLAPIGGRLFDRKNPVLFAAYVFSLMSLFPILLSLTALSPGENPQWKVYVAYAVFSFGWTGAILVWNLGSMFFANDRDVSRYTGAHVVLVGARALLMMGLAIYLVEIISPVIAFATAAICWLLASLLMFLQWKKYYRGIEKESA